MPKSRGSPSLNLIGSALLTVVIMLVVVGATLLGEPAHRIAGGLLLIAAVAVGGLFVFTERRSSAPLLPAAVRRDPRVPAEPPALSQYRHHQWRGDPAHPLSPGHAGSNAARRRRDAAAFSILVIGGSAAAARLLACHLNERIIAAGLGLIGIAVATAHQHELTGGTINRVAIDVSGNPYIDLEREAAAMLARE